MKYTEKVYLTRSPLRTNVKSSPKGLSAAIDYRYWGGSADPNFRGGGGTLSAPPPFPGQNQCRKIVANQTRFVLQIASKITSKPRLKKFFKRNANLEALLQAQCIKSLREHFHLIVQNLLKLLYFTLVLDISQCSHATPTILLTDMKTCVRDLMFDPETIQNCVENLCRKPS